LPIIRVRCVSIGNRYRPPTWQLIKCFVKGSNRIIVVWIGGEYLILLVFDEGQNGTVCRGGQMSPSLRIANDYAALCHHIEEDTAVKGVRKVEIPIVKGGVPLMKHGGMGMKVC